MKLTLDLLCPDAPVEIRVLLPKNIMKGKRFVNHAEALEWAIQFKDALAVYIVMNPFDESLIKTPLVSDEAVTRRCWILIDVDPTRTAHTNSTDRERASAHEVITRIKEYLTSEGWPDPLECDSGNGSHLLYSVDLPNDAATRTTLANLLKYLAMFFDTPEAHVDQEVFNASRITKLYGTMTRKGPPSEARPHRLSAITRLPEPLQIVTTAAFMTVAGYWREGAGETLSSDRRN